MDGLVLNPQVLQMIGANLNLSESEAAALQSGNYAQFFGERLAADPGLASNPMIATLMNTFASSVGSDGEDEDDDVSATGDAATGGNHRDGHASDADDAALSARAMTALRQVAAILGACHCWGQDPDCPDCDGLGEPGYRRPRDPALLIRWVQPSLRRMGLRLVRADASDRKTKPGEE